jgi:hypothetical protein
MFEQHTLAFEMRKHGLPTTGARWVDNLPAGARCFYLGARSGAL